MKARILPLSFQQKDDEFDRQVERLRSLLGDLAEILEPLPLGTELPEADAVVFPQMLGQAYRMAGAIRAIPIPRLVITSEFGTMSMWDWEIDRYLRLQGIEMITPYTLEQTKAICRALA